MCQQLRRIGRWWRPPRKLLQAGAASSDKGIAGAAALNGAGAEKGEKGPPQGSYLWYCRPCWDDWLVRYKQWFAAEDDEEWLANAESSEVSTSSSSFGGSKASRPRSLASTGEDLLHFDFIEVGTCNYHTFTQFVGGHPNGKPSAYRYLPYSDDPRQLRGLAVDMKSRYLDQLPDLPNVQKVRAALTEHEEVLQMYHVRLKDIEHWERIFATQGNYRGFQAIRLARGCSALSRHRVLRNALGLVGLQHLIRVRTLRTKTVQSLLQQYKVGSIGVLALDCEGHDCSILRGLITACGSRREWYPKWILFETNGMNDETFGAGTERSTVQALLDKGYELSYGGGFRDTGKRDTVLRRKW